MQPALAGAQVEAWVRDTGRGLTQDESSRLFQPFSQVGAKSLPGRRGGSGAGLSFMWRASTALTALSTNGGLPVSIS